MADFIFSKNTEDKGLLKNELSKIYQDIDITINEYHSKYGSIAFLQNEYNGFREFDTDEFLFIVIGGPVLTFRDNNFISIPGNEGTRAIYKKWKVNKNIVFDSDLSGPFALIYLEKKNDKLEIVTDLMSFIPIFINETATNLILSSHVDLVAKVAKANTDKVSIVDFILNKRITFPFTIFHGIYQLVSGSIYKWKISKTNYHMHSIYWEPKELSYTSKEIEKDLSNRLRLGFDDFIKSIVNVNLKIGTFLSGGEDSRVVLSALKEVIPKKSIMFIEKKNYETNIAEKVADIHGSELNFYYRNELHYLLNFKSACRLIGTYGDIAHAHPLGLHKEANLNNYDVIFGGFLSDTLLKGHHIQKEVKNKFLRFLPISEKPKKNWSFENIESSIFKKEIIDVLNDRRKVHYDKLQCIRPNSALEWFNVWPITMHLDYPNISINRRLFKSFEPFTAAEVVKVGALVGNSYKLDRQLFHNAMKPYFFKTKWIPHANGSYPYLSWRYNNVFKNLESLRCKIIKIVYKQSTECSFSDWNLLLRSQKAKDLFSELSLQINEYGKEIFIADFDYDILNNSELTSDQKRIILQLGYQLNENKYR